MSEENVNRDIEESARNVKNSGKAAKFAKEMEKAIKSNKRSTLWLAYQQGKFLIDLKPTIDL